MAVGINTNSSSIYPLISFPIPTTFNCGSYTAFFSILRLKLQNQWWKKKKRKMYSVTLLILVKSNKQNRPNTTKLFCIKYRGSHIHPFLRDIMILDLKHKVDINNYGVCIDPCFYYSIYFQVFSSSAGCWHSLWPSELSIKFPLEHNKTINQICALT